MAASSPSEFLTFYRTIRTASTFQHTARRCLAPRSTARPFSSTLRTAGDIGKDREHVLDKAPDDGKSDRQTNVQSDSSHKGRAAKATETGGSATQQKDTANQKDKILAENPEAPDAIGMQDERGSKTTKT